MPVHPIRRACAAVAWYRETRVAGAHDEHIASAEARGFKFIGRAAEGLFPIYRKQVFVDAPRTTQAHLSSRGYYFITYFESGKCVLTWNHVPTTPSSDVLESRATLGSFDANFDAHLAAIAKRSATDTPIVVPDLRTAIALGRFYYLGVVPLSLAATALMSLVIPLAIVAIAIYWVVIHVRF